MKKTLVLLLILSNELKQKTLKINELEGLRVVPPGLEPGTK